MLTDAMPLLADAMLLSVDAMPLLVDAMPLSVDAMPLLVDAMPLLVDAMQCHCNNLGARAIKSVEPQTTEEKLLANDSPNLEGVNVLVVDDEVDTRNLILGMGILPVPQNG
jgi:hypothetical protein